MVGSRKESGSTAGASRDAGIHHELLDRDELYREFIAAVRIYDEPDRRA